MWGKHICLTLWYSYIESYSSSLTLEGMSLDAVVGLEVVLANGTIVKASAEQYPDVFWVSELCTLP